MTTPAVELTQIQMDILARYGRGQSISEIATEVSRGTALVSAVIADLAGHDRGRAKEILRRNGYLARPIAAEPAPPPAPPPVVPVVSTLEAVLAAGEKHDHTRVRTLAARIRSQLVSLQAVLLEDEHARVVRVRIAKLEAELAEARSALPGGAKGKATGGSTPANIRSWARLAGVACPDRGRVPQDVVDQYEAAHPR